MSPVQLARRRQAIDQVARLIADNVLGLRTVSIFDPRLEAQRINATIGWTVDLQTPNGRPLRIKGLQLTDGELAHAYALADALPV